MSPKSSASRDSTLAQAYDERREVLVFVVGWSVLPLLLPPLRSAPHGTPPARKLRRLEQRALREMESETMREAYSFGMSSLPPDPKSRMAG